MSGGLFAPRFHDQTCSKRPLCGATNGISVASVLSPFKVAQDNPDSSIRSVAVTRTFYAVLYPLAKCRHFRRHLNTDFLQKPHKKAWRRGSESNRRIRLLQSPALPLGYPAVRTAFAESKAV